ncbi:flippase [Paenibacillus polymyxa]|uniref:flippase n=1 Tax=Paenibacillus polymyxa TaxID=1406 RepID=UPI00058A46CD|nr:flippase [Paenibacillus polymyxa]AJE50638.1 membrane protein [Paenibacillus polymyxa]QOH60977.1 flippase [Paenibacillus polymyxa]
MTLVKKRAKPRRSLLVNTSWLFGDKMIRMVFGLAVSIIMARVLGPEELGKWNYAESFFGMFLIFTTLGFDSILVRDLVKHPKDEHELLGTAVLLKLLGTLVAIVLSYSFISLLRPEDSSVRLINLILATASVFQLFDIIDYWFRAQMLSKYTVVAKNTAFVLGSTVKIILLLSGIPIWAVALCAHGEFLLGSLLLLYFFHKEGRRVNKWTFRFTTARRIMNHSWPLILSSSAVYVQARIDQVIIGELLGNEAVGQYSVALRLIEVLGFIPVVLTTAYAPVVTRSKQTGSDEYRRTLSNVYRLMFICFLMTSVPLFFLSQWVVVVLYGREFAEAGSLLSLFAIRLFFTNFSVAKSLFITNENLFKYTLLTSVIGAVTNIAFNYALIPWLGVRGSLVATILSFTISVFLMDLLFKEVKANLGWMMKSILTFWHVHITVPKVGENNHDTD